MKISIITTYYNSVQLGDFVNRSMECLINQSYKNIEFICVNDGSLDDTLNQLNEYARKDHRIIVIDKENEGVAQYAKAAGQSVATGDYIMLFDHDDLISLDAIEEAVKTLKDYPYLDGVTMQVETKFENGKLKNYNNLHLGAKEMIPYSFQELSGRELFKLTVGRYDVHFRGLIRKEKFKFISFRYEEKLLNGDEIVERLIFNILDRVGSCRGTYKHFIYKNSSAKSYNIKRIDIIRTDVILREIFIDECVYENRKFIFELTAYKNIINGFKIFRNLKRNLKYEEKEFYLRRIKDGYALLDKKIVLSNYTGINWLYNKILLSNFIIFSLFYSLKR